MDRMKHLIRKGKWVLEVKKARTWTRGPLREDRILLLDPSLGTGNRGDQIIAGYAALQLRDIFPGREFISIPTQCLPSREERELLLQYRYKILCGTNLMTSYYERFSNWKMPEDLKGYQDILTLGVGWGSYADTISRTSGFVYRTVLSGKGLHSVRDSYTQEKFYRMGIRNVVNTGCPTLWKLTRDHCGAIPEKKASRVVAAVTDYAPAPEADRKMLRLLKECYNEVYVWIQGSGDASYLKKLEETDGLTVIGDGVDAFTQVLDSGDIDYVGTRLHAGIHALNRGVRSIILSVDNRAVEMGRDFGLPILPRREDTLPLKEMIENPLPSEIRIPEEQIRIWKEQFKEHR